MPVLFFRLCFLRLAWGEGGGSSLGLVALPTLELAGSLIPLAEKRQIEKFNYLNELDLTIKKKLLERCKKTFEIYWQSLLKLCSNQEQSVREKLFLYCEMKTAWTAAKVSV